jgi:hypothetical protein
MDENTAKPNHVNKEEKSLVSHTFNRATFISSGNNAASK